MPSLNKINIALIPGDGIGTEVMPEGVRVLEAAAQKSGYPLKLHRRAGFDHGYYFIQSLIADHLAHHAAILRS